MYYSKPAIYILVSILLLLSAVNKTFSSNIRDNDPTIIIHDTIAAPGELLLQIDALNFTGDNGDVAAITLRIEIDTFLVQFLNIQNMTVPGQWLANYNMIEDEITITYNAPFGTGHDIDGKLLDLHLEYFGSFPADLHFKAGCEISNVNLTTIQGVVYEDGVINPVSPVGTVQQDTVVVIPNQQFNMPLTAQGAGYDMVTGIDLRVGYDTAQLEYVGFIESALTGVTVADYNEVLNIVWEDTLSPLNFTSLDTLLYMQFKFIGDTSTSTILLPGSKVFNNNILVTSEFLDGIVRVLYPVELINNPDTAGTATGGGYYFVDDTVTVTAIPEEGFHFINWSVGDSIITSDSIHTFVKQNTFDTLTANYQPDSHNLTLIASPLQGGDVFGAGVYEYGETVTVTAVPSDGYDFLYWMFGNDTVSFNPVYIFTMPNNNLELIAVFGIQVFTITATPNNPDYGTAEGSGEYTYGDVATLTATPFDDYSFIVWSEQGIAVSYDSIYTFTVYSDRNLVANFQYDSECPAPVGLYVDNLWETSAMLHWLPSGSEEEWDLLWGEMGFDTISGGELVEGLTETQYLLENLDPGTGYDFYVRSVCSLSSHSSWAGPRNFSTWFVGVDAREEQQTVLIYPNPVSDVLVVVFEKNISDNIRFRIVDSFGLLEMDGIMPGSNQISIRLDGLSGGVYVLQLFVENNMVTKIFVKK